MPSSELPGGLCPPRQTASQDAGPENLYWAHSPAPHLLASFVFSAAGHPFAPSRNRETITSLKVFISRPFCSISFQHKTILGLGSFVYAGGFWAGEYVATWALRYHRDGSLELVSACRICSLYLCQYCVRIRTFVHT